MRSLGSGIEHQKRMVLSELERLDEEFQDGLR